MRNLSLRRVSHSVSHVSREPWENSEEAWVQLRTPSQSLGCQVLPRLNVSVFSKEAHGRTLVPPKGSHHWLVQLM